MEHDPKIGKDRPREEAHAPSKEAQASIKVNMSARVSYFGGNSAAREITNLFCVISTHARNFLAPSKLQLSWLQPFS